MSRDAVWKLLGDDPVLQGAYGITRARVFPNYAIDGSPKTGYFLVLVWDEATMRGRIRPIQILTVWAHRSIAEARDFVPLSDILKRVREVIVGAIGVVGDDGEILSQARFTGEGRDMHDRGYDTLTRNAAFEINLKE